MSTFIPVRRRGQWAHQLAHDYRTSLISKVLYLLMGGGGGGVCVDGVGTLKL